MRWVWSLGNFVPAPPAGQRYAETFSRLARASVSRDSNVRAASFTAFHDEKNTAGSNVVE